MNLKIGIGAGVAATLLSLWAFTPSGDKQDVAQHAPEIKNAEVALPEAKVSVAPESTPTVTPATPAAVKVEGNAVDATPPTPDVAASKPVDPPAATPEPAKPSSGDSGTTSDPPKKKADGDGTKQPPPPKNPPKPPKAKNPPPKPAKQPKKQPPQPKNRNHKKPQPPAPPPGGGN